MGDEEGGQTRVSDLPGEMCDGCTECAMRCTDGVKLSEAEFDRILEQLREVERVTAYRVLEQPKNRSWFEDISYRACLLLDVTTSLCLVYSARPLVCRLFGRVKHLPCPEEKFPPDLDASRVLEAYQRQDLRTFQEWMVARGFFSFNELLGGGPEVERYEL